MMHRIMTDNSKKVASLKVIKPFDLRRLSDVSNDSTKWWQFPGREDRLGLSASINHLCGSCNRIQ